MMVSVKAEHLFSNLSEVDCCGMCCEFYIHVIVRNFLFDCVAYTCKMWLNVRIAIDCYHWWFPPCQFTCSAKCNIGPDNTQSGISKHVTTVSRLQSADCKSSH